MILKFINDIIHTKKPECLCICVSVHLCVSTFWKLVIGIKRAKWLTKMGSHVCNTISQSNPLCMQLHLSKNLDFSPGSNTQVDSLEHNSTWIASTRFMLSRASFHTCLQHHITVRSTQSGFLSVTSSVTTIWLSHSRMSGLRINWWKQKGGSRLQLNLCQKSTFSYKESSIDKVTK